MKISIIIPTKDRKEILFQTLENVQLSLEGIDAEVLVINDSKTQDVDLSGFNDKFKVIKNPSKGVASARNFGSTLAKSQLLWFLDDDMWINREMLMQAIKLNNEQPNAIFNFNWVYPTYLIELIRKKPFGRFLERIDFTTMKGWCKGSIWNDNDIFPASGLAGATLLVPAVVYKQVNGYDATFPLAGFEDYDFSVRVLKANIPCFIEPRFVAFHNEVNKTNLRGFLQRTFNNAITRQHAVSIGYLDQSIKYSFIKKYLYKLISIFQPTVLIILDYWPNIKLFDNLYFKICHLLIGANIYKGYFHVS